VNKQGSQPKGQVNSAYSNINKSVKKKLETQTLSGKTKNVHTEKHCRDMMARDPNLTYRECLNSLKPCDKCHRRWHLAQDCRKSSDGRGTSPNGKKKSFRKKFNKKGKVNNTVGRSVNFFDDDQNDEPWIGTVFALHGTSDVDHRHLKYDTVEVIKTVSNVLCEGPKVRRVFVSEFDLEEYMSDPNCPSLYSSDSDSDDSWSVCSDTYQFSEAGELYDPVESETDQFVNNTIACSDPTNQDDPYADMPDLISNSDSSSDSEQEHRPPQQPHNPPIGSGGGGAGDEPSDSSDSDVEDLPMSVRTSDSESSESETEEVITVEVPIEFVIPITEDEYNHRRANRATLHELLSRSTEVEVPEDAHVIGSIRDAIERAHITDQNVEADAHFNGPHPCMHACRWDWRDFLYFLFFSRI
jgi:hypothetical protein